VTVSFARDRANLTALATEIGGTAGESAEAAAADLVVLSVPWGVIDEALAQAGSLAGRIVIDTTNQFGRGVAASLNGRTAARYNADRMPGASYTKCFNTLTAGFQAAAATRTGDARVVRWIAGGDSPAKTIVAELVTPSEPRAWPPPDTFRQLRTGCLPAPPHHAGSRGRARGPASAGSARG
jgi:predicted dinucleotide-binding enzyme